MTEDEMVGWHHRHNGHEFEQALGDGEGQESPACCSSWGYKEQDTTEQLNSNKGMRKQIREEGLERNSMADQPWGARGGGCRGRL